MDTEMDARTQIRARLEPQVSLVREPGWPSRGTGRCQIRTLIQFDAAGTIGVRAGLHAEEERRVAPTATVHRDSESAELSEQVSINTLPQPVASHLETYSRDS